MSEKILSVEQMTDLAEGVAPTRHIAQLCAQAIHDALPEPVSVDDIAAGSWEWFRGNIDYIERKWIVENLIQSLQPYTSSAMAERARVLEETAGQFAEWHQRDAETIRTLTAQLAEAVEAVRKINYQAVNCMSINSLRKHIKGISRSALEASHD